MTNLETWFPGLFGLLFGFKKPMWRKILHPVLDINDDTDVTLIQKILTSSTSTSSSETARIATNAHALAPPGKTPRRRN